jgi:hypothetical protein
MRTISSQNFKKAKKKPFNVRRDDWKFDIENWKEKRKHKRSILVQIYKITGKASFILKSYDWTNLPEFSNDIEELKGEMNEIAINALQASNYLIPVDKEAQSLLMTDYPEMPEKLPDARRVRLGIRKTKELYDYLDEIFEQINILNPQIKDERWQVKLNLLSDHVHALSKKAKQRNKELFDIWQEWERVGRVRKLQTEINRKYY